VQDVLRIDGVGGTFAEREEVDGIQQVRLAHPILSDEAVHLGREVEFHLFQILIVQYGYTVQSHGLTLLFFCFLISNPVLRHKNTDKIGKN
jgi:hypothetical protein